MKRLILTLLLAGCAHVQSVSDNKAAQLYCEIEACPTFAERHSYQLLTSTFRDGECVCRLLSPNVPDEFDSKLPYAGGR